MLRALLSVSLFSLLIPALGCALCCAPDDYNYGAYGGRWQRGDMSYGRVGSVFTDVGFDASLEPGTETVIHPAEETVATAEEAEESQTQLATYIE